MPDTVKPNDQKSSACRPGTGSDQIDSHLVVQATMGGPCPGSPKGAARVAESRHRMAICRDIVACTAKEDITGDAIRLRVIAYSQQLSREQTAQVPALIDAATDLRYVDLKDGEFLRQHNIPVSSTKNVLEARSLWKLWFVRLLSTRCPLIQYYCAK